MERVLPEEVLVVKKFSYAETPSVSTRKLKNHWILELSKTINVVRRTQSGSWRLLHNSWFIIHDWRLCWRLLHNSRCQGLPFLLYTVRSRGYHASIKIACLPLPSPARADPKWSTYKPRHDSPSLLILDVMYWWDSRLVKIPYLLFADVIIQPTHSHAGLQWTCLWLLSTYYREYHAHGCNFLLLEVFSVESWPHINIGVDRIKAVRIAIIWLENVTTYTKWSKLMHEVSFPYVTWYIDSHCTVQYLFPHTLAAFTSHVEKGHPLVVRPNRYSEYLSIITT